jgi:hypothetical protein
MDQAPWLFDETAEKKRVSRKIDELVVTVSLDFHFDC